MYKYYDERNLWCFALAHHGDKRRAKPHCLCETTIEKCAFLECIVVHRVAGVFAHITTLLLIARVLYMSTSYGERR